MLRSTLKARVWDNLKDPTGTYWTDQKLNDSIQDGYDEIVLETECIEQVTIIQSVPGLIYYDLYDLIPGFWKLVRIFNMQTKRWITMYDQQILNRVYYSWERSINTPWFAYIVSFQYLAFFPHANSPQGFQLHYKVCRDPITDDAQNIQIPGAHIKVLEDWVTADLLESVQEFNKAKVFWEDYIKELDRFKAHVRARALPVERQILAPIIIPGP